MEEEIERLYLDHSDQVYRYIYLLTRHKENAEDLTQETFYKAYKNWNSFNHQSSVSTWLLKIARNVTYDYFRRKKIIRFFSLENENDLDSNSAAFDDIIERKEQANQLHNALKLLKKDYQDVLILRKVNECSIKETAFILGWTEAKVKTKMARALDALKKELTGEGVSMDEFQQKTR